MKHTTKEAQERLRTARATKAAHLAERAAKERATAKAAKAREALARKVGMLIIRETASSAPKHVLGPRFGVGWGAPATEKDLLLAILQGTQKLTMGTGSVTVAPKTLIQRTRVPQSVDVTAIIRAKAAEQRAYAKWQAAVNVRVAAEAKGFENGSHPAAEELFAAIAKDNILRKLEPSRYGPGRDDEWEDARDDRDIAQAELHLAAIKAKTECTCGDCARERDEEAREAAKAAALAALPRMKFTCPDHGPRMVRLMRGRGFFQGRNYDDLPVLICPVDSHQYVSAKLFEKDEKARAKLEAKRKAALRKEEREHARLIARGEIGTCDECGEEYEVGNGEDHCAECGTCSTCCNAPGEEGHAA